MSTTGELLDALAADQSQWSQATFGTDQERGPLGALRHLEKEAREAQEHPTDPMEYADCLLLVLDAARRAGFTPLALLRHAVTKMEINKRRLWPKPTDNETPVEHVKRPNSSNWDDRAKANGWIIRVEYRGEILRVEVARPRPAAGDELILIYTNYAARNVLSIEHAIQQTVNAIP